MVGTVQVVLEVLVFLVPCLVEYLFRPGVGIVPEVLVAYFALLVLPEGAAVELLLVPAGTAEEAVGSTAHLGLGYRQYFLGHLVGRMSLTDS